MRILALVGLGGMLFLANCGASVGPKVRVATATAAELQAVENQDNVWYEFLPGDVIPVQFGFLGAFEGGTDGPAVFRAKQKFYFVMFKDRPMQVSFDGETIATSSGQSMIGVVPRKDGKGAQLGWLIYVGESGDAKAELQKLIERADADAKAAAEQPKPEESGPMQ